MRRPALRLAIWLSLFLSSITPTASAQVDGGTVVAGSATINQDGSTLNVLTQTDRTIINWQNFSIGAGETANFLQPGANSAVLNRVVALNNPSLIFGALNSNGNVLLVNPSGVLVGPSGVINTNGFTASVLDIPNNEFLQGGALRFRGNSTASVINEGTINTGAGGAALIGGDVINNGTITSEGGSISLATGGSVTLEDGSRFTHADLATIESGISPYAGVIKNSGTIRATGAIETGGEVYLVNPGGKIMHDGTIAAQKVAADGKTTGGNVQLLGDNVQLRGATIDASGDYGGGQVNVGGNYQGKGPLPNATHTSVDAGTTINADATLLGDGGKVIVWADDTTTLAGNISARGGSLGGNGGFAEVSGKQTLAYSGTANLSAPLGQGGALLLDPVDFTFDGTNVPGIVVTLNGGASVVVATDGGTGGNGDVFINEAIFYDSTAFFGILAHGDILANASVQNNGSGDVALVAGWDGTTEVPAASGINSPAVFDINNIFGDMTSFGINNGSVFIGNGMQTDGIAVGSRFGATNVAAHNLTLRGSDTDAGGFAQLGFLTDPSMFTDVNGPITVVLNNNLTATAGMEEDAYVQLGHGGNHAYGELFGDIDVMANDITFSGGMAENSYAQLGHGGNNASGYFSGEIVVRGANITFDGGSANDTYAQIGHGGDAVVAELGGRIQVKSTGDVLFTAGNGEDAYVQIGHGGADSELYDELEGGIEVTATGDVIFAAIDGDEAYAQIGHGGADSYLDGEILSQIQVNAGNDVVLMGGSEGATYAQIGHGGNLDDSEYGDIHGEITVEAGRDVLLTGGDGYLAYAQISHGGSIYDGKYGEISGDIWVEAGNDIILSGANGFFGYMSYAQIGHGGSVYEGYYEKILGDITVEAGRDILLNGGSGFATYAQIGSGGSIESGETGIIEGDITVVAERDIKLTGGDQSLLQPQECEGEFEGEVNYAQIGHGGALYDGENDDLSGMIFVAAARDIMLTGGTSDLAYAQIGHGGVNEDGYQGDFYGDIYVIAGHDLMMTASDDYSQARIGHGGMTYNAEQGDIFGEVVVAWDQLNPLADGGGRFFMNHHSEITAETNYGRLLDPNDIRLFGTRRLGNVIEDGALIGGIPFDSINFPPASYSSDGWNENTEFASWDHEQWGPTASQFTLASPGPYTDSFTFFYLSEVPLVPPTDLTYDQFGRYGEYFRTVGLLLGPNTGVIKAPAPTVTIADELDDEQAGG